MELALRILLLFTLTISVLFSNIVSKDVNGGGGNFLSIAYFQENTKAVVAADFAGIKTFNVTDSLELIDTLVLDGNVKDVVGSKSGNTLYAAANSGGLFVLDFSNGNTLEVINSFPSSGQSLDLSIDTEAQRLAVAEDALGVSIYDVSSEQEPVLHATIETKKEVKKVLIKGDVVVTSYRDGIVEIFDISSGVSVKEYTFSNFLNINQMQWYEDYLVFLDGSLGLFVYDISIAHLPLLKGAFALEGGLGLDFLNERGFISTATSSIYELDLNNVSQILFVNSSSVEEQINEMVVEDAFIVASRMDKSFQLLTRETQVACSNEITYGKNPKTKNWSKFFSGCDVPDGWVQSHRVPQSLALQEENVISEELISSLPSGWHLLGTSAQVRDFSVFQSAESVWKFKDSVWGVYTQSSSLSRAIDRATYPEFSIIEAGSGFWVKK